VCRDNPGVLFELKDVSLDRGGRRVLDRLNASIPDGVTALVGPSGSGKSTVLRLLDRLADPDEGTVSYRGRDVTELDPLDLRREVCLVPQLPALLPGTVASNVEFAAELAGRQPDLEAVIRQAGLDASLAERRAMLARALVQGPDVLLLDEPTSALDGEARSAVEATIARLSGELDASIVLVTHDEAQAERLAGTILRMDAGRMVAPAA
jgi:putative ABC transport system ATP-binding protein